MMMHPILLIKRYLEDNLQSLFKGAYRPLWMSIVSLIAEHFLMFSLLLIPEFVESTNTPNYTHNSSLKWVSLHMITDDQYLYEVVICFLALNSAIYGLIAVLFLIYCIRPYKQKKMSILSFSIMNYNHFISIPSFFLSLQTLTTISSVNLVLTIILSFASSVLSSNYYNFILTDYLSKRGSSWDILKAIVFAGGLIGIKISGYTTPYTFFIMAIAIINSLNLLSNHLFHNKTVSMAYLSLNLGLIITSIFASSDQNTDSRITFLFAIICTLPLAVKLSVFIMETLDKRIIQNIDGLFSSSQLRAGGVDDELKRKSDFLIDYYTRYLISNYQVFSSEKKVFDDYYQNLVVYKQSQSQEDHDHQTVSSSNQSEHMSKFNLGLFVENQENTSFNAMKEKIRDLMEKLEGNIYAVQADKMAVAKQESNTLRYLFYLLEIEQNLPKVAIKIHEYIVFMKNHIGIIEQSILNLVKHELELKEQELQRTEIDLTGAFLFEENLFSARQELLLGHRQKVEFLKELSNDVINIQQMKAIGVKFVKQRDIIALKLLTIKEINHNNPELNHLLCLFFDNLWMDDRDKKCTLLNLGKTGSGKPSSWRSMIRKIKKLDYEAMSNKSCTVLTSLSLDRIGRIIKISKNSEHIIGFSGFDLVGKNCNFLQPHSIAVSHNTIIKQGIERKLQRHYNKSNSPIILKTKDGFGLRMSLELQVLAFQSSSSEIGLVGKLTIVEKEFEKYVLVDVLNGGCQAELFSKQLFNSLLFRYFKSVEDIEGMELHQIFPALTGLSTHMKTNRLSKMKLRTFGFLPVQKVNNAEQVQRRFNDQSFDILNSIQYQYFNISWNDAYLVDMSVRYFCRAGAFEVMLVKLKNIDFVSDISELQHLLENTFFPQLVSLKLITDISPQLLDGFMKNEDISLYSNSVKLPYYLQKNQSLKTGISNTDEQSLMDRRVNIKPLKTKYHEPRGYFSRKFSKQDKIVKETVANKGNLLEGFRQNSRNESNNSLLQNSHFNALNSSSLRVPSDSDLEFSNSKRLQISHTLNEQSNSQRKLILRDDITKSQVSVVSQPKQQSQLHLIAPSNLTLRMQEDDTKQSLSSQAFVSPRAKEENITFQADNINKGLLSIENLQQLQKEAMSKEPQESDSMNKDQNNMESKQEQLDRQTKRGTISSSLTSQSESLRTAVRQKIEDQKQKGLLNMVLFLITLAFIGMLVLIGVTYALLHSKLQKQELAFTFSWWQDLVSNHIISILRLDEVRSVIDLNAFAFSSDPDTISFDASIQTLIATSYSEYMIELINICRHDFNDLYLVNQLYTLQTNYTYFNVVTLAQHNETFSIFQAFKVASYSTLEITFMGQGMKQLTFIEVMSNVYTLQDKLAQLVILQDIDKQNLIDDMNFLVLRTLIIIILISCLVALIIFPFYSYFQAKKEFVLRLFASLEPNSVKEMYEELCSSIQILVKMQKEEVAETRENVQGLKSSRAVVKPKDNNDLNYFLTKKKKNVPTTSLPKFSFKLCLQITLVTVAINVQPIVNVILTSAQISEQETEQSIIKGLFSLETTLLNAQFAGYSYANKFINPYSKYLTAEYLAIYLQSTLQQIAAIINTFSETLYNFSNKSSSSTSQASAFISRMISSDICQALLENPEYTASEFNYKTCESTFNGVLKQGYLVAVNFFTEILTQFSQISMITDPVTQLAQMGLFFAKYDPLQTENLLNVIQITSKAILSSISAEKATYFNQINFTQVILFVFEIILLVSIFPLFIYPFFVQISFEMVEVVKMISILQLPYIQSNSYILNFLKAR